MFRCPTFFLLFILCTCLYPSDAHAETPTVSISAVIEPPKEGRAPTTISGTISIENPDQREAGICIYLPFNDPSATSYFAAQNHLRALNPSRDNADPKTKARTTLVKDQSNESFEEIHPYLWKIRGGAISPTRISFVSKLDVEQDKDDIIFDGFHPILLDQCPLAEESSANYLFSFQMIKGKLTPPPGWQPIDPIAFESNNTRVLHAQKWVVGLTRNYKIKTLYVNDLVVDIHYKSPEFLNLLPTIQNTLASHISWAGPFPFPGLIILESSHLGSSDLPGIVTLNRPRQKAFETLQTTILNWDHWTTVMLLAHQWYGTAIKMARSDDVWFISGTTDFLTLQALQNHLIRDNLFNLYDGGINFFSMNYQETQEMIAAVLAKQADSVALTDQNLLTRLKLNQQHPLIYIKHSIMLRYMQRLSQDGSFKRFIQSFTQKNLYSNITPAHFASMLGRTPSPFPTIKRNILSETLLQWWTAESWPDLTLTEFSAHKLSDGRWMCDIEITNKNLQYTNITVQVAVDDVKGNQYLTTTSLDQTKTKLLSSVITTYEPRNAVVDPGHWIFDGNRFDNKSEQPKFKFFPGSATSLADDDYTVIWLPYLLRRPGEKVSVGIYSGIYRYIENTSTIRLETEPETGKTGGVISTSTHIPNTSVQLDLNLNQNFSGYRITEVSSSAKRQSLWNQSAYLKGSLRERRITGIPETVQGTGAIGLGIGLISSQTAKAALDGEYEKSLIKTDTYDYIRQKISLDLFARYTTKAMLSSHIFWGNIHAVKAIPANVLFDPENLQEAHLRLDSTKTPLLRNILSSSNNLLLPFQAPMPSDLMILNKQLQWLLFYDFGSSDSPQTTLQAAGTGVILPLGGDLTGAGTLAFTRLSFQGVLFSKIGSITDNTPRLLFDFTGEL